MSNWYKQQFPEEYSEKDMFSSDAFKKPPPKEESSNGAGTTTVKDESAEEQESPPLAENGTLNTENTPPPQDKQETPIANGSSSAVSDEIREKNAITAAAKAAEVNYAPPPTLLASPDAADLIEHVDGPENLVDYNCEPSIYTASKTTIAAGFFLEVPIAITSGGSMLEYTVESEGYDIAFGVEAERGDKKTVVKPQETCDCHVKPLVGKFLVGTVPCVLIFTFGNEGSWFTEKKITYKIVVTPPSKENVMATRRKRAEATLAKVEEDKVTALNRLNTAESQVKALSEIVNRLETELKRQQEGLESLKKEEEFLKARVELRTTQCESLKSRLENGWEDETD